MALTDESEAIVAFGAKVVDGRARIIAQAYALFVDELVERTRHAVDCGADAVMVLPPFFEGPADDDGVFAFKQQPSRRKLIGSWESDCAASTIVTTQSPVHDLGGQSA
ncbi:dihydrodipicolinate synthase family protein [Caballeronia humi]|uniref:dihydrodipicolinate synthase family protein n=1 Tax=Caballeronia humi TaxID=326474 RepID=UPI0022868EC2|nr:dihydrodipicolinate synthase family protein [Caballeronia humi]